MNPASLKEAILLVSSIKKGKAADKNEIVLCPPSVYLSDVVKILSSGKHGIKIGAQDCFYEEKGAFTGEVSPIMFKTVGAKYVIIGHSERRALGETNESINKKIKLSFKKGIKVILCVGESERDETGQYFRFIETQIKSALLGINKSYFKDLIIAYEPIWAIGKNAQKSCDPKDIKEMSLFIKKVLAEISSREIGLKATVIYGGSVDVKNATQIVSEGEVDGLLIGRASLDAKKFLGIINSVSSI
ncbi:MAG: Triosephosphate isomerase [Parcubacteria group bacterium GW2011_GWF2_38_76]|nr:MAG: Triosephosphate isomerase [Parcubacteria group bacterium GW2011_GWF2_38_76]